MKPSDALKKIPSIAFVSPQSTQGKLAKLAIDAAVKKQERDWEERLKNKPL